MGDHWTSPCFLVSRFIYRLVRLTTPKGTKHLLCDFPAAHRGRVGSLSTLSEWESGLAARAPAPDWLIEHGLSQRNAVYVHVGGCWNAGSRFKGIERDQALRRSPRASTPARSAGRTRHWASSTRRSVFTPARLRPTFPQVTHPQLGPSVGRPTGANDDRRQQFPTAHPLLRADAPDPDAGAKPRT
ncbi:DUF6233 domain-containing protein [Streptomyces sp. NPDC005483]|uniref:DUF6233 domain-containing protein n=1 Tax=Streptomyces sp. NPDC005483 TaxID=3154882 RepID=UPI0033BAF471